MPFGKFYIKDLGSINGTFLNDVQVLSEYNEIKNNDIVRIADIEFRFVIVNQSAV